MFRRFFIKHLHLLSLISLFIPTFAFSEGVELTSRGKLRTSDEFTLMLGMTNVSFTENQTSLSGPNTQTAASGAISSINTLLHYRFKQTDNRAWFTQVNIPVLSGATGSYLSGGGGMEFTWGESPNRSTLQDQHTSLVISPTIRYFAGIEANLSYIAYLTETAKKSDTLIEIGGYGGIGYKIRNYNLRFQAGFDRGTGISTNGNAMKAMAGATMFID